MKEKLLEQAGRELKVGSWVDLVVMIVAVTVTLIFFAVAAGAAESSVTAETSGFNIGDIFGGGGTTAAPDYSFNIAWTIVLFVTLAIIVFLNRGVISMLMKNKAQRIKLNEGIAKLFKDETLDQYNDGSIYRSYETRYNLFGIILGSVMALSVIVPIVIFINQLVTKL